MVASLQVRVVIAGGASSHYSVGSNTERKYMRSLTRAAVPPWNGGVPRRHRKSSLQLGNQVDLQVLHCRVHVAALARVLRPVVKVAAATARSDSLTCVVAHHGPAPAVRGCASECGQEA